VRVPLFASNTGLRLVAGKSFVILSNIFDDSFYDLVWVSSLEEVVVNGTSFQFMQGRPLRRLRKSVRGSRLAGLTLSCKLTGCPLQVL
tara:strand:+ start:914 stop:1177 length:264 start_codon:yes stop_codon:yes gene_type:complete